MAPPAEPPGQGGKRGKEKGSSEKISISVFKIDLARQLVVLIMREGLMSNVLDHYERLNRVIQLLSDVDGTLRSVYNGIAKDHEADSLPEPE